MRKKDPSKGNAETIETGPFLHNTVILWVRRAPNFEIYVPSRRQKNQVVNAMEEYKHGCIHNENQISKLHSIRISSRR